jgi:hypothetical protein
VTNYLHWPPICTGRCCRRSDGPSLGNERFGRPQNPDFLLRPSELLDAFAKLTVIAFEQGEITAPRSAVIQRIAAIAGPLCRLPEAAGLDSRRWDE